MKYDLYTNETYNLYTIETSKFKNVHMEVIFKIKATKENITYASILSNILMESTLEYPSRKELTRRMYDLYNANMYAITSRVGDTLLINFVLETLDPKYTSIKSLEEAIELLFDAILNPNALNDSFDEKTFDLISKRLSVDIEAIKEDPKQNSILNAFKELDNDDIRSFNVTGDSEILESMTAKKLYKFYQDFIETSERDVYIIGNIDMDNINEIVKKYANFKSITKNDNKVYLPYLNNFKSQEKFSNSSLSQTNLVCIYGFDSLTDFEQNYSMPLFNMLFGSGSLESKLYKTLREENSLCYNVTTFYQKYDRTLIIHTAIDEENYKYTTKLISKTLNNVLKGDVDEQELENAKNTLITSLNLILDSPSRLIDMYLFKNLVGLDDIENRIDEIRKVSVDDIIKVSKKLRLLMTYRIKGA